MQKTLKIYQKRLTNLTTKNKALLLLKLIKSQFIDLHSLDFLEGKPSFHLIENLLAQINKTTLCSTIDSRDQNTNKASKALHEINRTNKFIYEERGAKDFYVGYPFVHGKMIDDTLIRCPLLFFPVSLEVVKNQWILKIRKDVPVSFNRTLLLAFSHYNNIQLEDSFLDFDFSEFPTNSRLFLTELYKLLKESPLELNFNLDNFTGNLHDFTEYNKNIFEDITHTGELKLEAEAVLGIFPQTGSYLSPDFDKLIKGERIKDIKDFFIHPDLLNVTKEEKWYEREAREEDILVSFPIDASQEEAVRAVSIGKSIVVQGPPGSGKSQLICNLIADNIAKGRNVLLVCQKKAALDVVYKRLFKKGFADFIALIHDYKNDRKDIYKKIHRQIENIQKFVSDNNSLDTIYLERNFLKLSREIEHITSELQEFRTALFDTSECGISIKELYLTSKNAESEIKLRREYQHFHFDNHENFLRKLKPYLTYAQQYENENYLWFDRVSFAGFTLHDLDNIKEVIKEAPKKFKHIVENIHGIIQMKVSLEECNWIAEKTPDFEKLLEILQDKTVLRYFKKDLDYQDADYLWLSNKKKNILNSFGREGIELSLKADQIANAQEKLNKAFSVQNNWWNKCKWYFLSRDKKYVKNMLDENKLHHSTEGLKILIRRLDNRMNFEHHLTYLLDKEWLMDVPNDYKKKSFEKWIDLNIKALEAKKIYISLRNGIRYLRLENMAINEINSKITRLISLVKDVSNKKTIWLSYLHLKQLNSLLENTNTPETLIKILDKDFDSLCEFDSLKEALKNHEIEVITKINDELGSYEPKTFLKAFENSIRKSWINHIEVKYPILRTVSTQKINQLERHLQSIIYEKQLLCEEIILLKVKERTYHEVEYNRLRNMVTYKDLKHQVSKKRSIWPVRKLISYFSRELFDLIPCWIASPESVSAIFPMENLFNIVIFDEASQCFAEKGIPAMYRGRQTIICGDDKQLAPYDLYQPRWEEKLEDEPALEMVSLLDLGSRYLPKIQLQGHYRSKSLSLIDFSNQHFYNRGLKLLPDFSTFLNEEPAIQYVLIDGVWQNNRNFPEADEVVDIVKKLLNDGITNIGIITFNFKQQELIQNLLEESEMNIPDEVFVKNIENVQGDERDVIIFSIGYAPLTTGKMNAHFGTLNLPKGENRLNVAITRAKEKVYVVCSVLPSNFKVGESKNEGPKLLKAYLQYAFEVSTGKFKPTLPDEPNHKIDWYLKQKIQEEIKDKVSVSQSLPFADLTLFKGGQPQVLILTDDSQYHQAISIKEAHAYTPLLLKDKGWKMFRFYSRNLWKNKKEFFDRFYSISGIEKDSN